MSEENEKTVERCLDASHFIVGSYFLKAGENVLRALDAKDAEIERYKSLFGQIEKLALEAKEIDRIKSEGIVAAENIIKRLEAENARLRSLVQEASGMMKLLDRDEKHESVTVWLLKAKEALNQ